MISIFKFNSFNDKKMKGRFIKSNKVGQSPAIILIEGSGQNPSEFVSDHDMYGQLMTSLAANGYNMFTFNKRGAGQNLQVGDYYDQGLEAFVKDSISLLKHVKSLEYVDENKVIVFGHSIGGWIISEVARSNDVAGIIMCATPGRHLSDFFIDQMNLTYDFLGVEDKKFYLDRILCDINVICNEARSNRKFKVFNGNKDVIIDSSKFIKDFSEFNIEESLKLVNCPVLIIQGTSDYIVSIDDSDKIFQILKGCGVDVKYRVISGLDHFLTKNKDKKSSFEKANRNALSGLVPEVNFDFILDIQDWSAEVLKC